MTALITGIFVFSSDVGCKMSGSLFCSLFNVSNEQLDRYWVILVAKVPCILIVMSLTQLIPTNKEIAKLAERLDNRQEQGEDVDDEATALLESEEKNCKVSQRHSMPILGNSESLIIPVA